MLVHLRPALVSLSILALAACASSKKEETSSSGPASAPSSEPSSVEEKSAAVAPDRSEAVKKKFENDPHALMTCVNGMETRTMAIATKDEGCELHYEKWGKDHVISKSSYNVTTCLNSRKKLHDELVKAGWKCQQ